MARDQIFLLGRRSFLRGSLGLAGLGFLAGCGPSVPSEPPRREAARIGLLTPIAVGTKPHGRAFIDGLRERGWIQGENLTIDTRFARAKESVTVAVTELMALRPDVIVAEGTHILQTLKATTHAVPIVMAFGSDPVATGLVTSLARPGGNLTGVATLSTELTEKRLDLLKQILPHAVLIACIWDPDIIGDTFDQGAIRAVAAKLGLQIQLHPARSNTEFRAGFEAAASSGADALVMLTDLYTGGFAATFGNMAMQKRLPTIAGDSEVARAGSLLAYGPSLPDLMRHAATYVDKILQGANPADLPIEQPTTFDFIINVKTAQAIGLTIPQSVLLQATEVIQ
jgi:putative ABC transport system substrate-binding protein